MRVRSPSPCRPLDEHEIEVSHLNTDLARMQQGPASGLPKHPTAWDVLAEDVGAPCLAKRVGEAMSRIGEALEDMNTNVDALKESSDDLFELNAKVGEILGDIARELKDLDRRIEDLEKRGTP